MKQILLIVLALSLVVSGCKSKVESKVAPDVNVKKPAYTVVVRDGAPDGPGSYSTFEIQPTSTSYEQIGFAKGYVIPVGGKLWKYQVVETTLPNARNCSCEAFQEQCVPEGKVDLLALVPDGTAGKDLSGNVISINPTISDNKFTYSLKHVKTSLAGGYFSVSACFTNTSCIGGKSVECSSQLFALKEKPTAVPLDVFAKIEPQNPVPGLIEKMLADYDDSTTDGTPALLKELQGKDLKPKLVEVVFDENRILRRWIIDDENRLARRNFDRVSVKPIVNAEKDAERRLQMIPDDVMQDGWSTGTMSFVDEVPLDRNTKDPFLRNLVEPRLVAVYRGQSNKKVVGWTTDSLR